MSAARNCVPYSPSALIEAFASALISGSESACRSFRPFGVSSRRFVNGLAAIRPSRCASANIVRATRVVPFGHCDAMRRAVGRSTRASSTSPASALMRSTA
jgi:hypothetical protein